jgi:hypothetical protein
MRRIPMRCTPVRCTPVRCTPVRCTPVRCTLVRYTLVCVVHACTCNIHVYEIYIAVGAGFQIFKFLVFGKSSLYPAVLWIMPAMSTWAWALMPDAFARGHLEGFSFQAAEGKPYR